MTQSLLGLTIVSLTSFTPTTYLDMTHNEYYLKGHAVTDPIANITFPVFAAASTLDKVGKTYYFISENSRREFEERAAQEGQLAKEENS